MPAIERIASELGYDKWEQMLVDIAEQQHIPTAQAVLDELNARLNLRNLQPFTLNRDTMAYWLARAGLSPRRVNVWLPRKE